ncbi:MAG: PHP domain-containing protein, partial [Clostridia bacterium]|nr:PHP domain-containing protein [Clostridia bacterium]
GVELSTYGKEEVHILGYNVPYLDPSFAEEVVRLQTLRQERVRLVVEKLRRHGVKLVVGNELDNPSAGRSHVAELLVKQGFVRSKAEAFDKYLGKGAPCYVDGMRVTPEDGVRLLRDAGAVPVLAHPYRFLHDATLPEMVRNLVRAGLMGIEVYYPNYGPAVRDSLSGLARTHHLIVTGGSDFHGAGDGAPVGSTGAFLDERAQEILLNAKS